MGRIIYAEDDEIMGALVSNALIDAGHAVGWLPDGIQALQAMAFRTPDLAILDWDMPEMPGTLVMREMRLHPVLARVPVLMLTAKDQVGDQKIAFYDGADDYMTKPFDPDELVLRAEALMAGDKRRSVLDPVDFVQAVRR